MGLHEDVRRTDDVPIEPVDHPEWKSAHVRPMSVLPLGEFKKLAAPDDADDDKPFELGLHLMAFLATHCLCDDKGARVFTDDEVGWVERNKTIELLEPIAIAAIKLHGLGADDEDRAKN